MSASRPCSIGWSAGGLRWSTTRPGVTRDRREGRAKLGDLAFTVIDTAGFEESGPETLTGRMRAQTEAAVASADAILFLIDARAGLTPTDRAFADVVRKAGKPTIVVANKSEARSAAAGGNEAFALGLGEPIAISAEHGEGLADLYDALRAALPEQTALSPEDSEDEPLRRGASDPRCRHRPTQCRQVDVDQPPARRGAPADRAGGRHHARLDYGAADLERPAISAARHRRHAAPREDRRQDRKTVGRRRA